VFSPGDSYANAWPWLRRAIAGFGLFTSLLNACGTLWILALMLLISTDVVGRAFFKRPVSGVPEMVSLSIVGIVFLQLASTLRAKRMTRSDMLLAVLWKRAPRSALLLDAAFQLAGALTVFVIFRASYPRFITAWQRHEFVGAVGHFTAPTWPIKLILMVGSGALAMQFLLDGIIGVLAALWTAGGGKPGRGKDPVDVGP